MRTIVYADGGCSPNPGPGGWGIVISTPDGPQDFCGGAPASTNNRMELTAAIEALERFPEGAQIEMRCDSQYVVRSMNEWIHGWKARGWRTTSGAVQNPDLMQRLDDLASRRDVRWTWVRGHNGDPLNERADRLATQGRREACSRPAQPTSPPIPATMTSAAVTPSSGGAESTRRTTSVPIDLALGLEISRAAKQAGTTSTAFVEECIKLVLALGPEETARLRGRI